MATNFSWWLRTRSSFLLCAACPESNGRTAGGPGRDEPDTRRKDPSAHSVVDVLAGIPWTDLPIRLGEVETVPDLDLHEDVLLVRPLQHVLEPLPVILVPLVQVEPAVRSQLVRFQLDALALAHCVADIVGPHRVDFVDVPLEVVQQEEVVRLAAAEQHHRLAVVLPIARILRPGLDAVSIVGSCGTVPHDSAMTIANPTMIPVRYIWLLSLNTRLSPSRCVAITSAETCTPQRRARETCCARRCPGARAFPPADAEHRAARPVPPRKPAAPCLRRRRGGYASLFWLRVPRHSTCRARFTLAKVFVDGITE